MRLIRVPLVHGTLGLPEHRYDGLLQIPHFYCGVTASNDVIYIETPHYLFHLFWVLLS